MKATLVRFRDAVKVPGIGEVTCLSADQADIDFDGTSVLITAKGGKARVPFNGNCLFLWEAPEPEEPKKKKK